MSCPSSPKPQNPAERNVAALVRWNQRRTETDYGRPASKAIRSVGIVGAGAMGTSIAAAAVRAGLHATVTDTQSQALDTLPARLTAELAGPGNPQVKPQPSATDTLLRATDDLREVARCDVVLETVVENLPVKERLLAELEPLLAEQSVLASNTSTLSIGRLAERLARADRFCGIHFFLPVGERPLIEVVRGPQTSHATLCTAVAFARALGKMPLVLNDSPGFLVNRLMMLYLSEGLQLLAEGASIEQIEREATRFGMAMGPMTLIDRIGLDIVLDCGWVLAGSLGESMVPSPILVSLVKARRLGRKSGQGFFRYSTGGERQDPDGPDPMLDELIARWQTHPARHTPESIIARLFLPMLLEATRVLAESRINDPREIDLAVIFGFGFPASQGGLLYWADTLGPARIVEMLRPLAPLGPRAAPTPLLLEMAATGRPFYRSADDGMKTRHEESN